MNDPRINKFNEWLVNVTNTHYMVSFWPLPWSWVKPEYRRYEGGDWRLAFGPLIIEKIRD